jgi:hypothetical protein
MSYQPYAPAPTAPAPPPPAGKLKPGVARYVIGGLLIAAGVITAISLLVAWLVQTSDRVDKFGRFRVPPEGAQATLTFAKPGTYTVYYESTSKVDGQKIENGNTDPPSQLAISVVDSSGTSIPIESKNTDFTFSFNGKVGRAVGEVRIPTAGSYTVSVTSNATEDFAIAVGKGVLGTIVPWLIGAIAAFLVGVGLGLALIITNGLKRGQAKSRRRLAERGYAPYGAAAAATGPPGFGAPGAYPPGPYQPAPDAPPWSAPPPPATPPSAPPAAPGPEPGESPWGPPQG